MQFVEGSVEDSSLQRVSCNLPTNFSNKNGQKVVAVRIDVFRPAGSQIAKCLRSTTRNFIAIEPRSSISSEWAGVRVWPILKVCSSILFNLICSTCSSCCKFKVLLKFLKHIKLATSLFKQITAKLWIKSVRDESSAPWCPWNFALNPAIRC